MWKIGLIGIAAAFFSIPLKREKPEFAVLIGITAGILIFGYIVVCLNEIAAFVKTVMDGLAIESSYLYQILKMLGITYVAEFASNICRDAGNQTIAGQIEIFAKLAIVSLSIPGLYLFLQVLERFL